MDLAQTQRPDDEEPEDVATIPTLRRVYSKEEGILQEAERCLWPGELRIGRGVQPAHLCLPSDGQVSREHAALSASPTGVTCRDLGSSNGTFVNGQRIREVELRDGDVVRIGNTLFVHRIAPVEVPTDRDGDVPSLIGQSPAARWLRREVSLVGPAQATVLLLGESGTGKEVMARALHQASGVSGSFVAVNCAAIPDSLAESQFFGHVAGAFTGAQASQGFFRAAHRGTLFLDEVGELALPLQAKLLRALEEGSVLPVGVAATSPCKVRLIAATNRDLGEAVKSSRMRGDLYARLCEILIRLPPLRARQEDILLLCRSELGEPTPQLAPPLAEALLVYDWPFNVRELLKVTTDLRVRGAGMPVLPLRLVAERLKKAPLPEAVDPSSAAPLAPPTAPAPPLSRESLEALLRQHNGQIVAVSRALGRSRQQVYRLLAEHALDPDTFRT